MESFFFQSNPQRVEQTSTIPLAASFEESHCYGVFHEPHSQATADHAVVFLYPWGQEYIRSHRAIRRLALNLQGQGVASLRFDYRGTGDASGPETALSLESTAKDAQTAINLLEELTGIDQIKLCAVRLGALMGEPLFADTRVKEIHLWDPVLSGAEYLKELEQPHITSRVKYDEHSWINGYPLGLSLVSQLAQSKLPNTSAATFVYGAAKTSTLQQWSDSLQQSPELIHCHEPSGPSEWGRVNVVGGFISPHVLLETLEKELERGI